MHMNRTFDEKKPLLQYYHLLTLDISFLKGFSMFFHYLSLSIYIHILMCVCYVCVYIYICI